MTSKEALKIYENVRKNYLELGGTISIDIFEAKIILRNLVERDTPKKVEIGTSKHFKFPICPNCKVELNEYYKNKYCKECGQRLDWSE